MTFDETDLIGFFEILPLESDPEAKEFFSSSDFEVVRGQLTLRVSFSPTHAPKVIVDLLHSDGGHPILHVEMQDAWAVRVDAKPRRLAVLAKAEGARGADPLLEERVAVFLDPLKVVVRN